MKKQNAILKDPNTVIVCRNDEEFRQLLQCLGKRKESEQVTAK
ncbi:hypothetical protein [Bacillus testis]|nr:hypothetical protein [Bacillus testis]